MAEIKHCRVCHGTVLAPVLDLGMTPPADDFLTEERLHEPEVSWPLKVAICEQCHLVQLTYVVPRETLYQMDYPYLSSTTTMGVRHYQRMAKDVVERTLAGPGTFAVDIGSNVGVLAGAFAELGLTALGVEPAPKIARMANLHGIETINEFFSADLACTMVRNRGKATIITGTNVVAHIDDLHDLFEGLRILLAKSGMFVFEAPYLGDLIDKVEYDTIYHEHLSYLSVQPILSLCEQFGFQLVHVERQIIHGGTLRYYIAWPGEYIASDDVQAMADEENTLYDRNTLNQFASTVEQNRLALSLMLHWLKSDGFSICAVSAPAKGMTLLNYCGIGYLLDFVTEKAPMKIGKYTPGSHLPVLSDDALVERQPEYALLLAWNFAEEIIANQPGYHGRFIIPIPKPTVVER